MSTYNFWYSSVLSLHFSNSKTEPQRLSVLLGTISLRWSDRPKETDNLIVKVAEVYPHPFYDHGKLLNDVSVIELATPVTFNGKA